MGHISSINSSQDKSWEVKKRERRCVIVFIFYIDHWIRLLLMLEMKMERGMRLWIQQNTIHHFSSPSTIHYHITFHHHYHITIHHHYPHHRHHFNHHGHIDTFHHTNCTHNWSTLAKAISVWDVVYRLTGSRRSEQVTFRRGGSVVVVDVYALWGEKQRGEGIFYFDTLLHWLQPHLSNFPNSLYTKMWYLFSRW